MLHMLRRAGCKWNAHIPASQADLAAVIAPQDTYCHDVSQGQFVFYPPHLQSKLMLRGVYILMQTLLSLSIR